MANSYDGGIIRWEDPPAVSQRPQTRPWALVALQLRQEPGRYALIADDGDTSVAHRIACGESWWAPKGSYEATIRRVNGVGCVWARYVG